MRYTNIATYRFAQFSQEFLPELQAILKDKTHSLQLKGTILLSQEGINLFMAGSQENITLFKIFLNTQPGLDNLTYKESLSEAQPYKRMFVKIKKEIISLGIPEIQPDKFTAPYISPETLKQWYEQHRDMVILDTRNDYEIQFGTFENAVDLDIKHFRNFSEALKRLPPEIKQKPIVSFCTGGIRCEKAATLLLKEGFQEVYQLEGGILNYFEKCGGEHYQGSCFVFDRRVAVNPELEEVSTIPCKRCGKPLNIDKDSSLLEKCSNCS